MERLGEVGDLMIYRLLALNKHVEHLTSLPIISSVHNRISKIRSLVTLVSFRAAASYKKSSSFSHLLLHLGYIGSRRNAKVLPPDIFWKYYVPIIIGVVSEEYGICNIFDLVKHQVSYRLPGSS